MKVIFLDIDGVLNAGDYCDGLIAQGLPWQDKHGPLFAETCVENLRKVVEQSGAKIVISSSWKRSLRTEPLFKEMLEMWTDRQLFGEMIDTTPNLTQTEILAQHGSMQQLKGYEIKAWICEFESLSKGKLKGYVILMTRMWYCLINVLILYRQIVLLESASRMLKR